MSKTKEKELTSENNRIEPVSHDVCNEMTDAQREAIVYHSKLLNKYYKSYDDMLREEAEFKKAEEEKTKLVEVKKARAKEVDDAYKEYLAIQKNALAQIAEAEKKWVELRDKFAQDYHGYHMTYVNDNGKESTTFGDLIDAFFRVW